MFGLHPTRAHRILIFQSENDDHEVAFMRDGVVNGLALTPEQAANASARIMVVWEDMRTGKPFVDEVIKPHVAEFQPDIVILDPPTFASNQAAVPRALAAYTRLTRLALAVVQPGGTLIMASCSSRVTADEFVSTVLEAANSAGADVHVTRRTGHAVDHPIGFEFGAYLKAVYLAVRSPGKQR